MALDCPFCKIIDRDENGQILSELHGCIVIKPLNPVVPGHLLVIPRRHVANALEQPAITATTMLAAATIAQGAGSCNLITSVGEAATQTVRHLHIHIVPRRPDDGLHLPWTNQP